ncbi:xylose isomerase [Edaphobacter acidisoli]|uniref:Xylose isomerase n=1 Tax=Edaphobacter acidisoli TaxID=2040573 RepID=A0A916RJQ8_9BACT|nr:sugar phosphate isomerase/epimerase [Edaphobacter acidisoli]GGA56512.1 xylose isomerase [Edaphobacter acidisoli]
MKLNRREFVAGATAFAFATRSAFSNPLGLPLAIQLYSVRQQMAQDLDMALSGVAAAGFTEVESAALPAKSAKEIRASLDKAGLHCVSSHHGYNDLANHFDEVVDFDTELGSKYIICSSPGRRTPDKGHQELTLDDWRFNAEKFNDFAEETAKHGIQFGYHNHIHEFKVTDGVVPYEELLKLTDPKKVTFELDCGWARVAGHNPVDLMHQHPYRFSMLHVKDFHLASAPEQPKVTELGRGDIDYKPVMAQARKNQHIRHAFVEQEEFDMPWQQSLKIDAAYMRSLR